MVGLRQGGMTLGRWIDENLVRVVGDGTRTFFLSNTWMEGGFT